MFADAVIIGPNPPALRLVYGERPGSCFKSLLELRRRDLGYDNTRAWHGLFSGAFWADGTASVAQLATFV